VVKTSTVHGACLASVAPSRTPRWRRVMKALTEGPVLEVSHELDLGLPVTYGKPDTIGADRLANAAGGAVRYGVPLIIADFGTAVTFDLVTRKDGYVGGIIAPGLPLMFDYLAEKTEKLPHLHLRRQTGAFGHTTSEAMQLGAQWGYRGMVREIVANLRKDPGLRRARLVATGGYAGWVVDGLRPVMTVDQDLTLFGLGCVFAKNVSPDRSRGT
jgi:type III pantothenate kinase